MTKRIHIQQLVLSVTAVALFLLGSATAAFAEDRAVIIGIYAYQNVRPAPGGIRDAEDMERFAREQLKFDTVRVLKGNKATMQNIQDAVRWLIAETKPGDRVLFYYSGHGSNLRDDDGDEKDDRMDETIVAYDYVPGSKNMIRDDQFARWIADLAGRRIVMIFDSCHSGTISRGGPEPVASSRYLQLDDTLLDQAPKTRNLIEVSDGRMADKDRISSQSDVVVISAARANQTAHAMRDNGQWRGALTLSLIEAYNNGAPTLSKLEDSINLNIKQFQTAYKKKLPNVRALEGDQIPEFATSTERLRNEPLFGLWESVPAIALVNPRSKIKVGLTTNDADHKPNAQGYLVYYDGETISYTISTDKPGYLYLLAFSQNPETKEHYVTMLFPHKDEGLNNEINKKKPMEHDSKQEIYELRLPSRGEYVVGASGLDVTVALVTTQKLNIEIKARYAWSELFNLLNLKELQQEVAKLSRSIEVKPGEFDWQAVSLPIFTTKK